MSNKIKDKQTNQTDGKRAGGKKWLLLGLSVAATGALSYFGFQYWKKNKQGNEDGNNDVPDTKAENQSAQIHSKPKTQSTDSNKNAFPLSKGSKGENVKALQEALIAKYGKAILPKFGADSDFGSEMVTALKKVGLPEIINEATFSQIVKGKNNIDPKSLATDLYAAAISKNFDKAISLLKTLRNAEDYKTVSNLFVNYRIDGVRQTLVNGMLNSFTDAKQKDSIRLAFSNMGLKYDGNKWSLSGIDESKLVITIQDTQVWKNPRETVKVPKNMVLGKAITTRGAYTLFENENQYFLVQTQHIKAQH